MTIRDWTVSEISKDLHAWLPPRRGWGLANCGLLVSPRTALWIDTPYDPVLAGAFLDRSRALLPEGVSIDRVVVTHGNGDHYWGAGVVPEAEIIVTRGARDQMCFEPPPQQLHAMVFGTDPDSPLGGYLRRHFGVFDWATTEPVQPHTYFTGELELSVGDYPVQISALPPAHTAGDLIVHLPAQRTVFTGDVVFASTPEQPGDHPVHWAGPLGNVVSACEQVLETGAEIFVPGHGPVLDRAGVRAHIAYLERVREAAHTAHAAGVPAQEAAHRLIAEGLGRELELPERLVVTIGTEYRHLDGTQRPDIVEVMNQVATLAHQLKADD